MKQLKKNLYFYYINQGVVVLFFIQFILYSRGAQPFLHNGHIVST